MKKIGPCCQIAPASQSVRPISPPDPAPTTTCVCGAGVGRMAGKGSKVWKSMGGKQQKQQQTSWGNPKEKRGFSQTLSKEDGRTQ